MNKSISCTSAGMLVLYCDTNKHTWMYYEKMTTPQNNNTPLKGVLSFEYVEFKEFNRIQKELYSKAIYGLSYYTQEEQNSLSLEEKKNVINTFNHAQKVINTWKQELINEETNNFLSTFFPNSKLAKTMKEISCVDPFTKCMCSFKELGIKKPMIASKLVEKNVLPQNFFQLVA